MEKIYEYIEKHATKPDEALDWVVKQTHIRTNHARMLSGLIQGQFLRMISQMCGAKRILELGTFTGFSAICLASGMGEGGHLDTLELNDELEDLILEGFERAGLEEVIQLHIGDCKETLKTLRREMGLPGSPACAAGSSESSSIEATESDKLYDIVYMDANKREYCEYYDLVFDMVRPGGLILADNVIWDGKVCQNPLPQDKQTLSIVRFNDMVSEDPRVESVILPLRDGINVIRKK
jgi:predicted O-methyltransferase YrrM